MLNYEQIKDLIKTINDSSLRVFELDHNGTSIKMSKNLDSSSSESKEKAKTFNIESTEKFHEKQVEETIEKTFDNINDENLHIVKSPLVGTYYSSAAPGQKSYAEVGCTVKKGDILCIVEAMKIMNEITSEYDGEIVEVLCKDEDMVEYGMPLFKIK